MFNQQEILALIIAHRAGNNKAWGELYLVLQRMGMYKYRRGYHHSIRFENTQDILSDVIEKLLEKFRTEAIEIERFSLSFIMVSFENAFKDEIRKNKRQKTESLDIVFDLDEDSENSSRKKITSITDTNTDDLVSHNLLKSELSKLLSELGPKQAQVAGMRFLEDLSPEEIAAELGIKTSQVYLNTCLAKKKLTKLLLNLGYRNE